MLLHALMPASRVNGPGLRAVVWFQGCSLGCDGCFNQRTHAFHGPEVQAEDVARRIIECGTRHDLDGVTFSGGEPMQQAAALLTILCELRRRSPKLSLGMFTGYTERELDQGTFFCKPEATGTTRIRLWQTIRGHLDFAIMGRYNPAQASRESICSSRNQVLRLFSDRHTIDDFGPPEVEIIIAEDGRTRITGFPVLGIPA